MPRISRPFPLAALLLALTLAGCSDQRDAPGDDTGPTGGVRVDEGMGGTPDPGFARAYEARQFDFPEDHGPHPDYATEWWYFTGNLVDEDGRRFGYQLTLFRVGLTPGAPLPDSDWRTHQIYMGHLAVSDIRAGRHHAAERFARSAAGLAGAETGPLRVWLGPWSIGGGDDPVFPLRLTASDGDFGIDLQVDAGKPVVLQGDRGLSQKGAEPGNASYYYSFTRLPTRGRVTVDGEVFGVEGDSWFDREWSSSALAEDQAGWDWFALQLDDGRDLMFYQMRGKDGRPQRFSKGVLVDADGRYVLVTHDQAELSVERTWTSAEGTTYPVAWRLRVPGHGLDLRVDAAFDAQEMALTVSYWEGAVEVGGSHGGRGYLELSGYAR